MSIIWHDNKYTSKFALNIVPLGDIIDERQGIFYSVDQVKHSKTLFYITDQTTQRWCVVKIEDDEDD